MHEASERPTIRALLQTRISELRQSNPEALRAWAEAHDTLLEHCIETEDASSVAVFVAKSERLEWRRFAQGELEFVEENCVHVRPDPTLYQSLFGMKPPALSW